MTIEEYKEKISAIRIRAVRETNAVHAQYAKEQEMFKIGDIIEARGTVVRITKIGWNLNYGMPYPIYKGDKLTKKLTVNKIEPTNTIYGNEGVKLIKSGVQDV